MADSIPGVFPCCQFPDSECTLWFSTLEAATYAYPPCADVYFPDLVLSTDEDFRSPNDEPHIDESERVITHGSYRSEEGFACVDGEKGSDIPVESDSEENIVPSESHDALLEYSKAFPDGHEIIWTPTDGLLCGFNAVVRSMQAMHWYLPCPTVESLQEVFYSPAFVEHATAFGMTNDNNFSIDQVGAVLYFWGLGLDLNLRIGYVIEGEAPQLLPHPNEELASIVWIHNDDQGNELTGSLGHFSGMKSAW